MRLLRLLFWDLPRAFFGDFVLGIRDDIRTVRRELRDDIHSVLYGDLDA